jgi:hypothetical protein
MSWVEPSGAVAVGCGARIPGRGRLGEENRWAQLKDKPLITGLAYTMRPMRLELQRAYAATTLEQARKRFESWSRWVQQRRRR